MDDRDLTDDEREKMAAKLRAMGVTGPVTVIGRRKTPAVIAEDMLARIDAETAPKPTRDAVSTVLRDFWLKPMGEIYRDDLEKEVISILKTDSGAV